MERCLRCGVLVETSEGVIDLDENGHCDDCREHLELLEVLVEDDLRSFDFDHSLDF